MMAGAPVAAGAFLLALPAVAAHQAGGVAEDAPPARRAVTLAAGRVARGTVLTLALVPGGQIQVRKYS